MHLLAKLLIGAVAWEGAIQTKETLERHHYWNWARQYCNEVGKPLLRIGMKRSFLEPPNGDITLDLDPAVERIGGGVQGDVRAMPFDDKSMGVSFCQHILEHLRTPEDVEAAISECARVADKTVLLCPSPYSIYASLFCPTHHLRLWFDKTRNKIVVRPNNWRTGLGHNPGVGQYMIVDEVRLPTIMTEAGPLPRGFVPG